MPINCYHGKAGVSLSEEARIKDNRANSDKGGFALGLYQALRRTSTKSKRLVMQESIMDPMP
jgi:hypothetical protein